MSSSSVVLYALGDGRHYKKIIHCSPAKYILCFEPWVLNSSNVSLLVEPWSCRPPRVRAYYWRIVVFRSCRTAQPALGSGAPSTFSNRSAVRRGGVVRSAAAVVDARTGIHVRFRRHAPNRQQRPSPFASIGDCLPPTPPNNMIRSYSVIDNTYLLNCTIF